MSLEFNRRMHKLFPGSAAWYKLFKEMDDDGSGKISFNLTLTLPPNRTLTLTPTLTPALAPALTLTLTLTLPRQDHLQ